MATKNKIDEMLLQFTDDLELTKEQRQVITVPTLLESCSHTKYSLHSLSNIDGINYLT